MQYFFILGRNPTLSIAEITNVLRISANELQIKNLSNEVLILETKEKLDCQNLQERLGGTIKIGEIVTQINTDLNTDCTDIIIREIRAHNKNYVLDRAQKVCALVCESLVKIRESSKKIYFGFSLYRLDEKNNLSHFKPQIKNLALTIKKKLKEKRISSRWVESKERILSSVIVQKNKLLTQGAEFCLLVSREKIYLGRTLSCQKFEEYEWRDFGRPQRKIEKGMMPPKLAKIMINLAFEGRTLLKGATLLDPFCGSGTILQEAALMGYKNVTGCDISEEAVKNSQENIDWLISNSQFLISKQFLNPNVQIFKTDVRNLSQKIKLNSIDAVVTEPHLGPIKILNLKSQISNLISELSELYLSAFAEFKKVLKKDGKIVIIWPVFKIGNQINFLPILDEVKKMGWQIINPIPENLRKNPVIKITHRDSIIYSRPDQKILREIFVFRS